MKALGTLKTKNYSLQDSSNFGLPVQFSSWSMVPGSQLMFLPFSGFD